MATTAAVKERPILFSSEMVRAILDGRKTQTRRVIKPQPHEGVGKITVERFCPAIVRNGEEVAGAEIFGAYDEDGEWGAKCPYGYVGQRLWVRETWGLRCWADDGAVMGGMHPEGLRVRVAYPGEDGTEDDGRMFFPDTPGYDFARPLVKSYRDEHRWRPSIHMPRWASRITLEITDVRVERLNDISEEDAKAEGMEPGCHTCGENCLYTGGCGCCMPDYRDSFVYTWMKCYGDDSWHANPWVWAISFKRIESER